MGAGKPYQHLWPVSQRWFYTSKCLHVNTKLLHFPFPISYPLNIRKVHSKRDKYLHCFAMNFRFSIETIKRRVKNKARKKLQIGLLLSNYYYIDWKSLWRLMKSDFTLKPVFVSWLLPDMAVIFHVLPLNFLSREEIWLVWQFYELH